MMKKSDTRGEKKNITQGLNTKGKSRGWSKEYFKIITCPVFHVSLSARPQHMSSRPRHSPVVNKINNPMTTLIPQREERGLSGNRRTIIVRLRSLIVIARTDYNNPLNTPFERKNTDATTYIYINILHYKRCRHII